MYVEAGSFYIENKAVSTYEEGPWSQSTIIIVDCDHTARSSGQGGLDRAIFNTRAGGECTIGRRL